MRQMLDAVDAFVYNEHNSAQLRDNGPARRKSTGRSSCPVQTRRIRT
ncbi:hypothetical protein RX403_00780 [Faecalibacterium prausnitzii]|nr:hypothetical protein [Faecalibacterium prausnitzii]